MTRRDVQPDRSALSERALDHMLGALRRQDAEPSADFLASLTETAIGEMPVPGAQAPRWRHRIAARLGRIAWPAGLGASALAASAAGIWFGGWAAGQGYLDSATLGTSDLAFTLVTEVPALGGLIGGY